MTDLSGFSCHGDSVVHGVLPGVSHVGGASCGERKDYVRCVPIFHFDQKGSSLTYVSVVQTLGEEASMLPL